MELHTRLQRSDFDSDAEYEEYLVIEAGARRHPALTTEQEMFWQQAGKSTLEKHRKRISIMVRERDLAKLKAKAQKLGMPYQTLINSVLHQFAEKE